MNNLNLFSSPSPNLSKLEQWSERKSQLGIDNALELHKLAFGFFLDRYNPKNEQEEKELEKLSKYEWFPGSVSSDRFAKELKEFLASEAVKELSQESQKQLSQVAVLLENQKDESALIDIHRSSDFRLAFLAKTGNNWLMKLPYKNSTLPPLNQIAQSTVKKVQELKKGEKAAFLIGTLTHETQISVEFKSDEKWELTYYDSRHSVIAVYDTKYKNISNPKFWEGLYQFKFNESASPASIDTYLMQFSQKQFLNDLNTYYSGQQKNTCHVRALLFLLKDHLVRHSSLGNELGQQEWSLFKKQFGKFLLQKNQLEDKSLIEFAEKKQKKLEKKAELRIQFLKTIQEGKFQEAVTAYQEAYKLFGVCYIDDQATPLTTLEKLHKKLIAKLKNSLVSADQLSSYFEKINHPLVSLAFQTYKQSASEQEKEHNIQLNKELEFVSSKLNFFAESLIIPISQKLGKSLSKKVFIDTFTPIEDKKLKALLDDFEQHPEKLTRLSLRPYMTLILYRGIQNGYLEQVDRIFQKLSEEDKKFLQYTQPEYISSLFPPSVEKYLLEHPSFGLNKWPIAKICQDALLKLDLEKFFKFLSICPAYDFSNYLSDIVSSLVIPEERIGEILLGIQKFAKTYPKIQELPYYFELLGAIQNAAFNSQNPEIFKQLEPFTDILSEKYIFEVKVNTFYKLGYFKELEEIDFNNPQHNISNINLYFPFDEKNYEQAFSLLKKNNYSNLFQIIFTNLIKSACKYNSRKMLNDIVKISMESAPSIAIKQLIAHRLRQLILYNSLWSKEEVEKLVQEVEKEYIHTKEEIDVTQETSSKQQ